MAAEISLPVYIVSKRMRNSNHGRVLKIDKNTAVKNKNLDVILRKANAVFDSFRFSGGGFTIDELVSKLKAGEEKKYELLLDFLEK